MRDRGPAGPGEATESPREGEDFLHRWSRRKAEARQAPVAGDEASAHPAPEPGVDPEPPPLTDADMPSIESLSESSDMSPFFSPGVSEQLRRLALRKIFSLAVYNQRDGLDDYDDDYTHFEPLGDTVTADMRHQIELREAREAEERARRELAEADPENAPPDEPAAEEAEGEVPEHGAPSEASAATTGGEAPGDLPEGTTRSPRTGGGEERHDA